MRFLHAQVSVSIIRIWLRLLNLHTIARLGAYDLDSPAYGWRRCDHRRRLHASDYTRDSWYRAGTVFATVGGEPTCVNMNAKTIDNVANVLVSRSGEAVACGDACRNAGGAVL